MLLDGVTVQWTISTQLSMRLTYPVAGKVGWAGVGFNAEGNGMVGGSLIVAYHTAAGDKVNEYYATAESQPGKRGTNRITGVSTNPIGDEMEFQFIRPLKVAGDNTYLELKNVTQSLLIAFNGADTPTSDTEFLQHTAASGNDFNLFDASPCPAFCGNKMATDPKACGARGTCKSANTCACRTGYSGSLCDTALFTCDGKNGTDPTVCNTRGDCSGLNTCTCTAPGYGGPSCAAPICWGKLSTDKAEVCTGRGSCFSPNVCICNAGFKGAQCESVMSSEGSTFSGFQLFVALTVLTIATFMF